MRRRQVSNGFRVADHGGVDRIRQWLGIFSVLLYTVVPRRSGSPVAILVANPSIMERLDDS